MNKEQIDNLQAGACITDELGNFGIVIDDKFTICICPNERAGMVVLVQMDRRHLQRCRLLRFVITEFDIEIDELNHANIEFKGKTISNVREERGPTLDGIDSELWECENVVRI